MIDSHFFSTVLRQAHLTRPQPSSVQLQLTPGKTFHLSYGVVEQLHLLAPAQPSPAELDALTTALGDACENPIPIPVVQALLSLDEDTRRYAQRNQIVLTVEADGRLHTRWDGLRLSRELDSAHWLLHLPEGDAPAGQLWNALLAARLCARASGPG